MFLKPSYPKPGALQGDLGTWDRDTGFGDGPNGERALQGENTVISTSEPYTLSKEENKGNAFRKILHLNRDCFRVAALPLPNGESEDIKYHHYPVTPRMRLFHLSY